LQIERTSGARLEDNDYLIIKLPSIDVTTAHWDEDKTPVCSVLNGGSIKNCEILNRSEAKITFNAQ
jgi:hypothetical protein